MVEGRVVDVYNDMVTVEIYVDVCETIHADFSNTGEFEVGDIVEVVEGKLQRQDLGQWAQEEIDEINRLGIKRFKGLL